MDEQVETAIDGENVSSANNCAGGSLVQQGPAEFLIWTGIAFVLSVQALTRFASNVSAGVSFWLSLRLMVKYNAGILLLSTVFILTPIMFLMIFGDFPLKLLQRRFSAFKQLRHNRANAGRGSVAVGAAIIKQSLSVAAAFEKDSPIETTKRLDPCDLLARHAARTSELAKRMHARAGVCLLVGVIVSFVGLAFFYSGTRDLPAATDYMDHVFGLLPGLGILLLIESIALLLIREYRATMAEFKYFDAVRRGQEDKLIILKTFAEKSNVVSTEDMLDTINVYLQTGTSAKNDFTSFTKSRRQRRGRAVLFNDITGATGHASLENS